MRTLQSNSQTLKSIFFEVLGNLAAVTPKDYHSIIEWLRSLLEENANSSEDIDLIQLFDYVESLLQGELVLHHMVLEQLNTNEVTALLKREIELKIVRLAKIALSRHPGVNPALLYYVVSRRKLRKKLRIDDPDALEILAKLEESFYDDYTEKLIKLIKATLPYLEY